MENILTKLRIHHNSDYRSSISYLLKVQAEHYYKEGCDFFKMGQYTESLALCDMALVIKPDYTDAWDGRGVALFEFGRDVEAAA